MCSYIYLESLGAQRLAYCMSEKKRERKKESEPRETYTIYLDEQTLFYDPGKVKAEDKLLHDLHTWIHCFT